MNTMRLAETCRLMFSVRMSNSLIGVREAAAILGMSKSGVAAAVRRGRLKPAAVIGDRGVLVFDQEELERHVAEQAAAS